MPKTVKAEIILKYWPFYTNDEQCWVDLCRQIKDERFGSAQNSLKS